MGLVATFLAAFATLSCAYSAIYQQKATFTSVLYGKEIEQTADLFFLAEESSRRLHDSLNFHGSSRINDVKSLKLLSQDISSLNKLISISCIKLSILFPDNYSWKIIAISDDFEEISHYLLEINDIISSRSYADTDRAENIKGLEVELENLYEDLEVTDKNILHLRACISKQLQTGKPVDSRYSENCKNIAIDRLYPNF
jgi:hypothetical protein